MQSRLCQTKKKNQFLNERNICDYVGNILDNPKHVDIPAANAIIYFIIEKSVTLTSQYIQELAEKNAEGWKFSRILW